MLPTEPIIPIDGIIFKNLPLDSNFEVNFHLGIGMFYS